MRRRLVLLSLATTVLVVVSFVVPLGLLVRRQASDSVKVRAGGDAQAVAALVALAIAVSDDPNAVGDAIGELPPGTVVMIDDIVVLGTPQEGQGSLAAAASDSQSTIASNVYGGWEIALPVVGASGVVVVDSFVTAAALTEGVAVVWLLLAALGLLLIGVAVWVADRMGRRLTRPVEDMARSAHQLAEGNLETRVDPSEPEEIRQMGEAFNYLAGRLAQLLAEEREEAADLSHRLRTPLTSLRLEAESLTDPDERGAMVGQVDRLEHAMNQVIELARAPAARPPGESELNEVVRVRAEFWRVLADEQERDLSVTLGATAGRVGLRADEVEVLVDTLVGNVFSHTKPGIGLEVSTGRADGSAPWLQVADMGPGFGDRVEVERGVSSAGSTGLGLDIVAKTAKSVGGNVELSDRPEGGAVVRVYLG